jgi:hypothetical protein
MRRRHADIGVARIDQQLPQHVAEPAHRPHRQLVALPRQGRQRMERPEDIARAIDEKEMITFLHGGSVSMGGKGEGRWEDTSHRNRVSLAIPRRKQMDQSAADRKTLGDEDVY